MSPAKVLFTSASQDWKTPKEFYAGLDKEFSFDHDPCPSGFIEFGSNGLTSTWGKSNFVNPPYSDIKRWMAKCASEAAKGSGVVALIPSRTDTSWWHDYCMKADEIRFIRGRLYFDDGGGRAPFPSALIIWAKKERRK